MFPGIVPQTPASTNQAPNAAGCQLAPDDAEIFDTALESAFGPVSDDTPFDPDATAATAEQQLAVADPSALSDWWLALAGGAPVLADGTATPDVSAASGSPSEDEDGTEEEGSDLESLESLRDRSNVLGIVALLPQPLNLESATDGTNVSANDDQPQSLARALSVPIASAPLCTEDTEAPSAGPAPEAAPAPLDTALSNEAAGPDRLLAGIDRGVEASETSASKGTYAPGADADQPVDRDEMASGTASAASEARRRPAANHTPKAASNVDAVSTSPAPPPVPQVAANGKPHATQVTVPIVPRSTPSGETAAASVEADVAANDATVKAELVAQVLSGQGTALNDGSAQGRGDDASQRGASPEFVAAKLISGAQVPAMVLVHGPDGTLRLSPAPTFDATLAATALTSREGAENISRLIQTMRVQMKEGVSEATVHLRPEHLGEVSIAIRLDGKTVSAIIHAESAGVREWIQAQENTLRSGLSEQGLHLDRLLVQRDPRHDRREQAQPEQRRARIKRDPATPERFEVSA